MEFPTATDSEQPYVRVLIETAGNLGLANVGRFMQRLDTGARRIAQENGWRQPSIEIVSITTSSLDLKIKIAGLRVAQASLAISIAAIALSLAEYLKTDAAASKASYTLLNEDRATTIIVEGGGQAQIVLPDDVPNPSTWSVANRSPARPSDRSISSDTETRVELSGLQSGVIRQYAGGNFVEFDLRPGLLISVVDQRADRAEYLEDMARYTFDGEVHMPPSGKSFYVVREAIRLR